MEKTYKFQILDGFFLKLLAFLFMTLDHVGVFLMMYSSSKDMANSMYLTGYVFRCIGRVAFPLFILMLTEGIRHSKNVWNYLLRIGIMASVIMVAEIIIFYAYDSSIQYDYSPLIDLFLCGLTLALLQRKDKFSFLAILPIALILFTFGIQAYERFTSSSVNYFPFYLRAGYSILGLFLSLGFYYSYSIVDKMILKRGLPLEEAKETSSYRLLIGVMMVSFLIIINVLTYISGIITYNNRFVFDLFDSDIQTWSIFASIFILLYNGKRGYNKKWFQYGSYLYFPVHIVIIFLIFYLIYK